MMPRCLPAFGFAGASLLVAAHALAQGAAPAAPQRAPGPAAAAPPAPQGTPATAAAAPAPAAPAPAQAGAATGPAPAAPQPAGGAAPYYQPEPAAAPAPAAAPPTIFVAQPPLPPVEPRNRYYHDGFYLRLSAGFGGQWSASSTDKSNATATVAGSGGAFDILMGGTPAPGLVVGGGLILQEAMSPSVEVKTGTGGTASPGLDGGTSAALGFGMLGPMIDAFPNPNGGFHFGGLLGVASIGLKGQNGNQSTGGGLSAWGGYMWWVSSQWSLGGLLRFSAARTSRKLGDQPNEIDVTDATQALTFMLSTAYH